MIAAKGGLAVKRRFKAHLDSPTGDKHREHPAETVVGAIRGGRQAREEGDDAGRSYLYVRVHTRNRDQRSRCGDGGPLTSPNRRPRKREVPDSKAKL